MTTEEMLSPRYEVVSDYPNSDFEIGEIITTERIMPPDYDLPFLDKYKHIFRKMGWWEKRKIEEMPEYLKQSGFPTSALPDVVVPVRKHFSAGTDNWRDDNVNYFCAYDPIASMHYNEWIPATKEDYDEYLNQLKIYVDNNTSHVSKP